MKKSFIALGLTAAALLASCGKKDIKINPNKEKYTVGVCQLVEHPALDKATQGFKDNLEKELASRGRQVEVIVKTAAGEGSLCNTIVQGFISSDVDLILGNATQALQSAFNATEVIPVLGTSITDYQTATTLPMKDGKSGTNLSGTSDIASIEDQVNIMVKLLQDSGKPTEKIGILYCSSEANSKFQVNEAKKYFSQKGITVVEHSFSETSDLSAICTACLDDDALYIPTDNTVAKNAEIIKANISDKGVPIFTGEANICAGCGFATLSIDYYRLGEVTGKMAAEILVGEKDIREYAIQYDTNPAKMYNKEIAESLGITIPSEFVEIE